MQFILDNLLAILIAGVLFAILVGIHHGSRTAAVESSNYYALKQQEITFVETLKRDLQNVTELYSLKEDPVTMEFRFRARTNPADTTCNTVTYRREFIDEQEGERIYRISRLVDGSSRGASMSTLVEWKIIAQDEAGDQATSVAEARQILVRFEALNLFEKGDTVDKSQWEATFRPPHLQPARAI